MADQEPGYMLARLFHEFRAEINVVTEIVNSDLKSVEG
jgi:hypothetical protein